MTINQKFFLMNWGDFQNIGKEVSLNAIKKLNSKKLRLANQILF